MTLIEELKALVLQWDQEAVPQFIDADKTRRAVLNLIDSHRRDVRRLIAEYEAPAQEAVACPCPRCSPDWVKRFAEPAQEAVAVTDEMVEAAARRWYRDEHGPINHHDSVRTPETDETDRDLAFGRWDRGNVAEPVKNGYRRRARNALTAALARPAQAADRAVEGS